MLITHKTILYWLIYITAVVFAVIGSVMLDLPQLVLAYDHSHLSVVLIFVWVLAEILSGIQALSISRQNRSVQDALAWLNSHTLHGIEIRGDSVVLFESRGEYVGRNVFVVEPSPFAQHLTALWSRANKYGEETINQRILLDTVAERIYARAGIGEYLASRIVWVGILATIVGVIMAFWPFMAAGMTVEGMRQNLSGFFGGVAVAFIPTALSFVFKIALDVNAKIVMDGAAEVVDGITLASEAHVVPFMEQTNLSEPVDLSSFGVNPDPEMVRFIETVAELDAVNEIPGMQGHHYSEDGR